MKLELNADEVKAALLQHVAEVFPGFAFNSVEFDCSYGAFRGAELSYEASPTEEQSARIAAILAKPETNLTELTEALQS